MIIIGAGGLAKQILDAVERIEKKENILFFDNLTLYSSSPKLFNYVIIQDINVLKKYVTNEEELLVLGVGKPSVRKLLYNLMISSGLKFRTFVSHSSLIGKHEIEIGDGTVVMERVCIDSSVKIGKGTLLNNGAKVFHDSYIGDFCELAPGCKILGKCKIGNEVFIGANAVILQGVEIGDGVIVEPGTVVTENIF